MTTQLTTKPHPAAFLLVAALAFGGASATVETADSMEPGRFVWHDLLTKDVDAAKRFYGELLGWRFEDTKRGDRAYVLARLTSTPLAGIVDVSANPDAGPQWLSFMSVADVNAAVAAVQVEGGKILVEARDLEPFGRVAVVADPQGAPLGLAQLRRPRPEPAQATRGHFFWMEYLASDAPKALEFYKRLVGYDSALSDSRLGVDYHILRTTRGRAGLFQLPATAANVLPNWLPYVLVDDPAAMAPRVESLGGRILVPAAPERRNGSLVVIADPGGAALALQKFPF